VFSGFLNIYYSIKYPENRLIALHLYFIKIDLVILNPKIIIIQTIKIFSIFTFINFFVLVKILIFNKHIKQTHRFLGIKVKLILKYLGIHGYIISK
jgi:hypothetical protein